MRSEDLIQKLVETGHLNVPERQELSLKIVPGTAVIRAIANAVKPYGKYPGDVNATDNFEGICLEKQPDGKYMVTVKAEYSMNRFGTLEERAFADIKMASEFAAKRNFKNNIDGIEIDWTN